MAGITEATVMAVVMVVAVTIAVDMMKDARI